MTRAITITSCALAVLLASAPAAAQIETQYGLGSRATSLGGAFTAIADDVSAVHYNPAGLALRPPDPDWMVDRKGIDFHFSFLYASPQLWLRPGTVSGGQLSFGDEIDLSRAGGDGRVDHPIDASTGLVVGARFDFNRIFGLSDKHVSVALGLALYTPIGAAFRWEVIGPQRLHWPMYADRTHRMSILPALAIGILRRVAIGFGLRVLIDVEKNTEAVVLSTTETAEPGEPVTLNAQLGNHATIFGRVAPTFSVLALPTDYLRLGLHVRLPLYTDDWGFNDVDATRLPSLGLGSFGYTHRFAHFYSPLEVSVGIAARPIPELLITTDATWSDWRGYRDSTSNNHGGVPFRPVVVPRVGVGVEVHPSTTLQAGYAYEPSPFDNRQSWTNFVDSDKHVLSLGTTTDLVRALDAGCAPIRLSWHAQLHLLRDRREVKDWKRFANAAEAAANPGFPGWLAGGWAINVGLSLDADF